MSMQKPSKVKPKTPKRSTTKHPVEEPEAEPVISHGVNLYHLGTEIGRGGFAVVFQAFNATTGQTVAVKRFPLSAIAGKESQLSVQLAEIELMHELDHPNIVKYYDTVKTKSFLYIVLEYMENGSLVNLIKKFGCFSETLTAIYVMQVLSGLKYLHDQGVLHRDIKGANILTSKDGMVKLADFGVAMKMADVGGGPSAGGNGLEDNPDLAGSPYWMAPEIIEMSTPTSACDIWSVGCVVIELLTSKPPYYDMDPMSALFRIVSDDYPPFPEGISQAAKDFLLQCFHKEPSMRSSAAELLSHPWLSNSSSRQSLVQTSQMLQSRSMDAQDTSVGQSTEVIQSAVRMYERNLQTIPEAENELIDTDRSRATADSHHPLQTSGMSARTSARDKDSARDSTSTGRSSARDSTNTGRSSARYSARSENSADSVVPVEVKPISALQEEEPNWHSVLLTGSTSLPGSADSRSRSHSGDEASRPSGSYDSNFAISAESGRSSSLISQQSGRAPAATTTTATTAAYLQPTARDSSFDFENTHVLASPQKLSGEENSPSSAPTAGTHAHTTTNTATSDVNMEETITPPPAGTAETVVSPRSGRTLSARSGSLQGMKIISDDSMDETNWDIDFTVSASRDSIEETGAASIMPRHHLLRNALGVAQQHSPGRSSRGGHPSNAPFLINLNAQSLSFTGSKPVDPPTAVPTTTTTNTTSAAAADTSPGFDSEEDDFLHEHTVPPPAAEHVRRMQIPQIKIPAPTLPRPPASSLYKLSNNHSQHSSLDLVKYQDNPEDDDFAEFDTMSQLSTPRGNNNKTKAITNKFSTSNRSISSAPSPGHPSPILKHTQYINAHSDDDFESDFALDGTGFDDKIKAFKTNSRQSSITILDTGEGEGGGVSNNNEKSNIFTARTDDTTTGNTTSNNIITSPSSNSLLANQLRKKIQQQQQQQVATKDNTDEDLDAFINYQYDEKDFKQNETKDLHFRRSREIVEIMNLIRQEVKVKEIIDLCNQLLMIFSDIPEQRDHLITHHGVMPIVDMFDTRCSSSTFRSGAHTSRSTKALYVLKVVNKIIEGNVKAKEQLSLVGIIPTVMNLFDNSFRHSVYHPHVPQVVYSNINHTATGSSSTSTDSVGEIAHQLPGITLTDPRPPLAPHIAMRDDIDPVTLEAARFIHQICSTSSLTLQMLIGAGGLSVLTSMVSLGSTLSPALFSPHAMNTAAASASSGLSVSSVTTPRLNPNTNNNNVLNNTPWMSNPNAVTSSAVTLQRSASGSSSPLTDARAAATSVAATSHGIATLAAFSNDFNDVAPVTDQQLADDVFFNPKSSFTAANLGADSEEILNRMSVFQMGVDCVAEVFSMKASRSRDFCRLFVKLGLLQPLALSFQNILAMFRARQLNSTNTSLVIPPNTTAAIGGTVGGGGGVSMSGVATAGGDTATTSSTNATPRESFRSTSNTTTTIPNPSSVSNQHRRDSSGLSQPSPRGSVLSLPSPRQTTIREDSLASSHTGSFYLFSSQQEAEESAECKYALRMATLFFTFSRSDAIVAETMVKAEHCVLHVLLTALQAPELRSSSTGAGGRTTPSGTNQHSNKTELVLSAASLSAHNAGTTTSPSLLRRTHVHLLPTYTEIMDLLLKCLKNLSMEPSALADLEAAGTLETLVPLLSGPMSDRYRNHILPCIFNMCRINKRRQERVAALGIIPHLKKVISDNSPLRQFALPILFDLAHTCDTTRRELGRWNCQAFFLDLLKENYWQAFALNSLAVWLTSDPSSVVSLLIEPAHLAKLIEFFKSAHSQTIHTLHRPLLDMMLKSSELCKALGKISLFTNILIKRLRYTDEAIVLRSLLKMLQLLYEFHENSKIWVESNNLIALVEEFAKTERKVLVRQLARKLLIDFTQSDT